MRKIELTFLVTTLFVLCFLIQGFSACADYGNIVYVNAGATGSNDGTSWANGYVKLQDALATACSCANVTQIWITAGTYYPDEGASQTNNLRTSSFQLCNGRALYGGFNGTETLLSQRNWTTNVTILSGDIDQVAGNANNAYHVVTGSTTNNTAILDGFTVSGGNANGADPLHRGGGIYNVAGSPVIRNCIFNANNASTAGGASYNNGSTIQFIDCSFTSNTSSVVGGAISIEAGCNILLSRCLFQSNSGGIEGGALVASVSDATITNCIFKGNTANYGGAISGYVFPAEITNCVFSGNKANHSGGAIYMVVNSDCLFTNCTFSGNWAVNSGGAIHNQTTPGMVIVNSIIWNNRLGSNTNTAGASIINNSATTTISYSDIANSGGSTSWNSAIGTNNGNNIDINPGFITAVDPSTAPTTAGNLRLTSTSPCRDAGNNAANATTLDPDNNNRISSCAIDMGAYEFQGTCPPPPQPPVCPPSGNIVYVDANATGSNSGASWTNSLISLQDAYTLACSCAQITQIWVADGSYYPDHGYGYTNNNRNHSFNLCNDVIIYGGFAGGEANLSDRNWINNKAILNGDIDQVSGIAGNSYHVVVGSGTNATAAMDGVYIQNGNANGTAPLNKGGGMYTVNGTPVIKNCTFMSNNATIAAAMYNENADIQVTSCEFTGNNASLVTGAVANMNGSSSVFRNCNFTSNSGDVDFGTVYNEVSHPEFINCAFRGNNAISGSGGAMGNWASNPILINCLFSGNRGGGGAGALLNMAGSTTSIINCTFSGNKAGTNGGAMLNNNNASPTVINSVFWFNQAATSTTTTSASVFNETGGTASFSYCLVANSGGSSSWNAAIGTNGGNNIATNPLFVQEINPSGAPFITGNYSILTGSPAKDSGNTAANFQETNDLAGNPRRAGCIDRGAYEFVQSVPPCPGYNIVTLSIIHPCIQAGEDSLFYYPTWKEQLGLKATLANGLMVTLSPANATWTSSHPARATVTNGQIYAITAGKVTISVTKDGITGTLGIRVIAPSLTPVFQTIPTFLSKPADECAPVDMPVLIIRYMPTSDGVNLDVGHAPDFYSLNPLTIASLQTTLGNYDERVKFALEEGTRFRDYGTHTKPSYLGYRVVGIINVYEPIPRGPVSYYDVNNKPCFANDYYTIAARFNIEDYVNDHGIKEIWLWNYGMDSGYPSYNPAIHRPCNFRFAPESNMASPLTGDVSNSAQIQDDLPIYDHTYIVYGQNLRRSQAEAIHNHGHQIERMIPHMNYLQDNNTDLFWKKFVGQDAAGNFITGRCGWTHMPPNTITNYDYENTTLVSSDIRNWTPAGGSTLQVNVNTWGNMNYIWPGSPTFSQKTESQWYIMWMQSMPGNGNTIPHTSNFLTNWWNIIGDWDKAITSNFKLYLPTTSPLATKNVIVSKADSDYGSMRSVIQCAPSGSTITLSPFLSGDTLKVLTPILLNKTITLEGNTAPLAVIKGSTSTFIYDVINTGNLTLRNLQLLSGTNTSHSGIRNFGVTTLFKTKFTSSNSSRIISNHNNLIIQGSNSLFID